MFYDRFLEQRAPVARDLYQLLQKNVAWTWEEKHQQVFESLKKCLLQQTVLAHNDLAKPLVTSCDTSPCGITAILAQEDSWGREAPIAFASWTLELVEWNYVQLDREGLAMAFVSQDFHQFIAGRKVTFHTNYQPILGILDSTKPVPQVLSPRMVYWCISLSAYD